MFDRCGITNDCPEIDREIQEKDCLAGAPFSDTCSKSENGFDFSATPCIICPGGTIRDGRRGADPEFMEKAVETTFLN
jgi:hypothetical protein